MFMEGVKKKVIYVVNKISGFPVVTSFLLIKRGRFKWSCHFVDMDKDFWKEGDICRDKWSRLATISFYCRSFSAIRKKKEWRTFRKLNYWYGTYRTRDYCLWSAVFIFNDFLPLDITPRNISRKLYLDYKNVAKINHVNLLLIFAACTVKKIDEALSL